jgi:hypothetical protein
MHAFAKAFIKHLTITLDSFSKKSRQLFTYKPFIKKDYNTREIPIFAIKPRPNHNYETQSKNRR